MKQDGMELYALRYQEGETDKFWAVRRMDTAYAVSYGKTGCQGRCIVKECGSAEDCAKAVRRQMAAKKKAAYRDWQEFPAGERLYLDDMEYGPHRLTSHPRFTAHFTEEFFYDCVDKEAPFGSDEGSDALEDYIREHGDAGIIKFPQLLIREQWDLPFHPTRWSNTPIIIPWGLWRTAWGNPPCGISGGTESHPHPWIG